MTTASEARDPEVLELFIEETTEALARVERLLLYAEKGDAPPDLMTRLFRDLHTMKGTAGFLALEKMASLAHAAEDLLSVLRETPARARPEHFAALLETADVLRKLMDAVKSSGDEGPQPIDELKLRLRAGASEAPAAPAAPQDPLPQLAHPIAIAAPAVAPAANGAPEAARAEAGDASVRVNVAVLDSLMNLMGELVLARNQVSTLLKAPADDEGSRVEAFGRLSGITSELQQTVMKARMQPVGRVFEKLPRLLRDLCQATGKRAECTLEGATTEIDKALVDAIRDPLLHVVRNAVDHGIESPEARIAAGKPETGAVAVRASHQGGMVCIEISDDGRGMDPARLRAHAVKRGLLTAAAAELLGDREAVELVFRPGFSTAETVTDISGRGVGMDVVRTQVERAGGQVELDSVAGQGTTVRLKMPLTLAIVPALLVESSGRRFAIPQAALVELVHLDAGQGSASIVEARGAPLLRLRGELLPLVRLSSALAIGAEPASPGGNVVVVSAGARRYGIWVDKIHDAEEIVVKPLTRELQKLRCYAGAAVLGDGAVALILDVAGVAALAGLDASARPQLASVRAIAEGLGPQPYLIFTVGAGTQCAVPLAMVARLEQVPAGRIERIGRSEVVQYRGAVLPLLRPEQLLPLGELPPAEEQQLVVFDFGRAVGFAVRAIVDVVDLTVSAETGRGAAPLTLGQAVVLGRTTLLLDAYSMVRKHVPDFARDSERPEAAGVLLVDDSNAMRAAVGGFLRARGLEVLEAHAGGPALQAVRDSRPGELQAVVTDLEMAGLDGFGLIEALRRERPDLPVIAWTQHESAAVHQRACAAGARACVHKLQREGLVAALAALGVGPLDEQARAA